MAGVAELCRARVGAGERARGPGATRSRQRGWRGAKRAAARTIWSPEPPAASKKAAAAVEHVEDDSGADGASWHAALGENGRETVVKLATCFDLDGEVRSGGVLHRRRRAPAAREREEREGKVR